METTVGGVTISNSFQQSLTDDVAPTTWHCRWVPHHRAPLAQPEALGEQEEHEHEPLITELEAPLVVPLGFKISEEPPPADALAFAQPASAASKALEGRRLMRKWGGVRLAGRSVFDLLVMLSSL